MAYRSLRNPRTSILEMTNQHVLPFTHKQIHCRSQLILQYHQLNVDRRTQNNRMLPRSLEKDAQKATLVPAPRSLVIALVSKMEIKRNCLE